MVNDSIAALGGQENAQTGWQAMFEANRNSRGQSGGYTNGEKIAIKVNINGSGAFDDSTDGETQMSYTNPVLLKSQKQIISSILQT